MSKYSYSGFVRFVTINTTGTYDIVAAGGQGGTGYGHAANGDPLSFVGGKGALVTGEFDLTAGEHLEIIAGSHGGTAISSGGVVVARSSS